MDMVERMIRAAPATATISAHVALNLIVAEEEQRKRNRTERNEAVENSNGQQQSQQQQQQFSFINENNDDEKDELHKMINEPTVPDWTGSVQRSRIVIDNNRLAWNMKDFFCNLFIAYKAFLSLSKFHYRI